VFAHEGDDFARRIDESPGAYDGGCHKFDC
jgi:hypothetical protein